MLAHPNKSLFVLFMFCPGLFLGGSYEQLVADILTLIVAWVRARTLNALGKTVPNTVIN
jgi:hypothetical protein